MSPVYNDVSRAMTPDQQVREDYDPQAPQREAAMFYGLFLRGHSADGLRRDIELPKPIVAKLMKRRDSQAEFRESLRRVYQYRQKVLAIFDELVGSERNRMRIQ